MSIAISKRVFVAISPKQSLRDSTRQAGGVRSRRKGTVFVAMSGGVDSSVAALLLKAKPDEFEKLTGRPTPKEFRGYDVTGVFMRCYNIDGCAERDAEDARRVAEHLKIPFYVFDFEKEYKKKVVEYMIRGYRNGITPNPDVMCNKEIKFGLFLEKALEMGADYVATGHYARLGRSVFRKQHNFLPARKFASLSPRHSSLRSETKLSGLRDVPQDTPASPVFSLFEAKDKNKDQSYFLWTLTQEQLKHCLFPIGNYLKSDVRKIARKARLPTAEKKDSQGICFLGKVSIKDFLKKYIKPKNGNVLDTRGKKIGEHEGAQFYTIGQRHLNIAKRKAQSANDKPLYIANKNTKTNTIIVAEGDDNSALYRKEVSLKNVNFINLTYSNVLKNIRIGDNRMKVLARVRYRQPLVSATLIFADGTQINADKTKKNNLRKSVSESALIRVLFEKPQKAVAPGQSAVFYSVHGPASAEATAGREILGGGIIV